MTSPATTAGAARAEGIPVEQQQSDQAGQFVYKKLESALNEAIDGSPSSGVASIGFFVVQFSKMHTSEPEQKDIMMGWFPEGDDYAPEALPLFSRRMYLRQFASATRTYKRDSSPLQWCLLVFFWPALKLLKPVLLYLPELLDDPLATRMTPHRVAKALSGMQLADFYQKRFEPQLGAYLLDPTTQMHTDAYRWSVGGWTMGRRQHMAALHKEHGVHKDWASVETILTALRSKLPPGMDLRILLALDRSTIVADDGDEKKSKTWSLVECQGRAVGCIVLTVGSARPSDVEVDVELLYGYVVPAHESKVLDRMLQQVGAIGQAFQVRRVKRATATDKCNSEAWLTKHARALNEALGAKPASASAAGSPSPARPAT